MHSHPAGILYYLSDATLKMTYPDGKTEVRDVKSGTAVWSEAVTHAVENIGTTELHEVHTELKGSVATFRWRHTRETMPASHQIAIWNSPAMKWSWRTI
jgi:hypothetical protein